MRRRPARPAPAIPRSHSPTSPAATSDPRLTLRRQSSIGGRAEEAVARHLEADGYHLLGRNVRLGPLEIDLVAQKGDLVALVEVRTRGPGAYQTAFGSVTAKKRETLLRAAERWAREHRDEGWARLRIDVAAVRFDAGGASSIEYAAGAITAS